MNASAPASNRFMVAVADIRAVIAGSQTPTDPGHAENTLSWLRVIAPEAGEILQLAALAHDIERAIPDRLQAHAFDSYDDYKYAHARRGGRIAADIAAAAGYLPHETARLASLIEAAEFASGDPEVQLIGDADSVSFFDNNLDSYLEKSGEETTRQKMAFMYERASDRAKALIDDLHRSPSGLSLGLLCPPRGAAPD